MARHRQSPGIDASDFAKLLDRLMREGVRPRDSDEHGTAWTEKDFAFRCGRSTKQVRNWLSGQLPGDFDTLERVFFGSDKTYRKELRETLRHLYNKEKSRGLTFSSYALVSTVTGIWKQIKERANLSISNNQELYAENVSQLAWNLRNLNNALSSAQAEAIVLDARSSVYDVKYGDFTAEDDERHVIGINEWNKEIEQILFETGIEKSSKLLVVGIGPGLEGVGIYDKFAEFHAIDVSRVVIQRASSVFQQGRFVQASAENLPDNMRDFDCIISLKTFNSSFFGIESAVESAHSSLKQGGTIILSVPRGYFREDRTLVPGLSRTNYRYTESESMVTYSFPDRMLPFEIIDNIVNNLYKRMFFDVRIRSGISEHYIIARKAAI
jgi:SAM-dependent methyltransferase